MPEFNNAIKLYFTVVVFVGANVLRNARDRDDTNYSGQDNVQSIRQHKRRYRAERKFGKKNKSGRW
jgi:hypothetical protein